MKFSAPRSVIVEAVDRARQATASTVDAARPLHGVKMSVKADTLVVTGTDLDLTVTARATVAGAADGEAVVSARALGDALRVMADGDVTVESSADTLSLSALGPSFGLAVLPVEAFPRVPELTEPGVKAPAAPLLAAIGKVAPAASSDTNRPVLTAVLLSASASASGLRLVATDSYRLAMHDVAVGGVLAADSSALVAGSALAKIAKLFAKADELEFRFSERMLTVASADLRVTTRLVQGEYPAYGSVIPAASPVTVTLSREAGVAAFRAAQALSGVRGVAVAVDPVAGQVRLSASEQSVGTFADQLPATVSGADTEVVFSVNPAHVLPALAAFDAAEVTIGVTDALKPLKLTASSEPETTQVVMPVR